MKNSAKKKRILKTASFLLVLFLVLNFLQEVVLIPWEHGDVQVSGFYTEPKHSLDVVMIGSSDIYFDFSPCRAYEKEGFTSYVFAPPRNSVAMWKTQLDEILRTQSPDLIVVEINGALYEEEELASEENVHFFTDHMPFSRNMARLINRNVKPANRLACYIPYLKYHGNIPSFSEAGKTARDHMGFLSRKRLYLHGQRTRLQLLKDQAKPLCLEGDHSSLDLEANHEASLREFLQYCSESVNIPLLFIRSPHCVFSRSSVEYRFFCRANRAGEIISEYGYPFRNYDTNRRELKLDASRDFNDAEHLSIYGQKKFTDSFAAWLSEAYKVGGASRNTNIRRLWEESLGWFHAYLEECFSRIRTKDEDLYDTMEYESSHVVELMEERLQDKAPEY